MEIAFLVGGAVLAGALFVVLLLTVFVGLIIDRAARFVPEAPRFDELGDLTLRDNLQLTPGAAGSDRTDQTAPSAQAARPAKGARPPRPAKGARPPRPAGAEETTWAAEHARIEEAGQLRLPSVH